MEWASIISIVKGLIGLAGVASIIVAYYWGYKKGKDKGYTEGYKASEENLRKEKMRIYSEIQKKASIKTEKKNAKIVD